MIPDRESLIEDILRNYYVIIHGLVAGTPIQPLKWEITNAQWMALLQIYQNEGIGVKELAQSLGISSSAATQLVDNLVKKGYLERRVNPVDRRALKIRLSRKLKNLGDTVKGQIRGGIYSLFDVLTDEELKQSYEASGKVAARIRRKKGFLAKQTFGSQSKNRGYLSQQDKRRTLP